MSAYLRLHDKLRMKYVKANPSTSFEGGASVEAVIDNMTMMGGSNLQQPPEVIAKANTPQMSGGAINDIFPYFQEELKQAKGENIDMKKTVDIPKKFMKMYEQSAQSETIQEMIRNVSHQSCKRFSGKYKVSNAYIKLEEIFSRFNIRYEDHVKHFDLCAAPGMFIVAMKEICERNKIKYTYDACSKKGGLEWMEGIENKFDFDILTDELSDKYVGKYNLVTSDVGFKYDPNILVEEQMFELQAAQLKHALLLLEKDGNCILKMFTCATNPSCGIVDEFSRHFKSSFICKPISSRILNDECYLVGLGFDTKIKPVIDTNSETLIKFETKRGEIRENIWNSIKEIAVLYDNQIKMLELYVTKPTFTGASTVGNIKVEVDYNIEDSSDEESSSEDFLEDLKLISEDSDSDSETSSESESED